MLLPLVWVKLNGLPIRKSLMKLLVYGKENVKWPLSLSVTDCCLNPRASAPNLRIPFSFTSETSSFICQVILDVSLALPSAMEIPLWEMLTEGSAGNLVDCG